MLADIALKQADLATICRRYDVARLEVFGSAARGVDFDPATSDVDFLVEFREDSEQEPLERHFGLARALEDLLGRRVDLVKLTAVRNPYIRAAIERSREFVYGT